MEYNKIVAVTGLGGLYELISSKADGGVVRSLEDKTSKFVSNRMHSFSHLESIEIYTQEDNVNMVEVLQAMQASKESRPANNADNNTIKAYFEKVYPKMDFDRVYVSDMKKMIKWLDILINAGVEIKQTELQEVAEEETEAPKAEKKTTEKKASKPAANTKAAAVKNAPAKKVNAPRKMA